MVSADEGLLRALKLNRDIGPEIVERARNLEPIGLLFEFSTPKFNSFHASAEYQP